MERDQQRHLGTLVLVMALAAGALWLMSALLTQPALGRAASPAPAALAPAGSSPAGAALLADIPGLAIGLLGPETTFAGETVTYTVRVTNTNAAPISNIILTDTWTTDIPQNGMWQRGVLAQFNGNYQVLPSNAVFSFTYSTSERQGIAAWRLNPLPAGQSVQIVLTMTTPITLQPALAEDALWGRVGRSILNNSIAATVPGQGSEPAPLVTTLVVAPLLRLQQSAVAEVAPANNCRVGRLVTYTFQIQNLTMEGSLERPDAWPAANLVFTVVLPSQLRGATPQWSSPVPGVVLTYSAATGKAAWHYPETFILERGASTSIVLRARVPADATYNPKTTVLAIAKTDLTAWATTMVRATSGYNATSLRILSPFDKSVATSSPPSGATTTFPNRVITYTLTFYNPLQSPLSDMILEDDLFQDFRYHRMIQGPTPALTEANHIRWEGLNVSSNGVFTTVFEVFVPPTTAPDSCGEKKYNAVSAFHPAFPVAAYIGHDANKLAQVTVDRQLRLSKTVFPTLQLPGELVTYTIKLENVGNTPIPGPIVVTDTLPELFLFVQMLTPVPGNPTVTGNVLRWDNVPGVAASSSLTFSFQAQVDGNTDYSYKNAVTAQNAHTCICPYSGASVKIDLPFRVNKIASTTIITQGDTLYYDAQISNVHPSERYSVTRFMDTLPAGFTDVTDNDGVYERSLDPPAPLPPGGVWSTGPFYVRVDGFGTGTSWCIDREPPGKAIAQAPDSLRFDLIPGYTDGVFNKSSLASIKTIVPHVYLLQTATPNPVAMNEVQTITLTLHDNRTHPTGDVTGVTLRWQIPSYNAERFTFVSSVPAPSSQTTEEVLWAGLTVPKGGEIQVVLQVRAPIPQTTDYKRDYTSRASVTTLDDPSICIPPATKLKLQVRRGIELSKVSAPKTVGPFGIVQYTLKATNLTGAPVHNVILTDVLPAEWQYVDTLSGPPPVTTDPLRWELELVPANGAVEIKFRARTYIWVGPAYNRVIGEAPINLGYTTNYTDNVAVTVVSGVGFFKTVAPQVIQAGETTVYTITLYNGLTDGLKDIVITDTLPTGFNIDRMLSGPIPQVVDGKLVWRLTEQLANGKSRTLVFRAQTDPALLNGQYYNQMTAVAKNVRTNGAEIIPPTGDTAPVWVHGIDAVRADKSVAPEAIRAGGEVTYTITLFNESEDTTYPLVVTDTLPYSLTYVAAGSPPPTVIAGAPQRVVWTGLNIAPQQTLTLTFRAQVARLAPSSVYCNNLKVKMGTYVVAVPNLACLTVTGIPRVDAYIAKDDGVTQVDAGAMLTYTVRYGNAASSTYSLTQVVLTETIVPLEYMTVLGGPGWSDLGDGRFGLEDPLPLAPGEERTTTFTVQLAATVPATAVLAVINQAEIGYTTLEETIEANTANNVAVDVNQWQGPDLAITGMRVEPAAPESGKPLRVFVTVQNQGMSAANQRHDGSYDPGAGGWLFVTELYLKDEGFIPSGPPADVFDHWGGYCGNASCDPPRGEYLGWPGALEVNQSQELTFNITAPAAGTYQLYAQADVGWSGWYGSEAFGLILETREENNVFIGPSLTVKIPEKWVYLPLVLRQ